MHTGFRKAICLELCSFSVIDIENFIIYLDLKNELFRVQAREILVVSDSGVDV